MRGLMSEMSHCRFIELDHGALQTEMFHISLFYSRIRFR